MGLLALRNRAEREKLEHELLKISEREKQLIAHELHDGLCQQLVGTSFMASILERQLRSKAAPEAEQVRLICEQLNLGASEARNIAHGLHPVRSEAEGLRDALAKLANSATKLFHLRCTFACTKSVQINNPTVANNLFRIAQEALNNAIKHGQASEVGIQLKKVPGGLILSIRDNGIGISRDLSGSGGMGMQIMKHRANVIGAALAIRRTGKRGTLVRCTLPEAPELRNPMN